MPAYDLPSIDKIAEALGGYVINGQVLAPGPGHSAKDRSLSVKLDSNASDGFVVHSFANDDPLVCRDYVRKRLGLPEFDRKRKPSGFSSKNEKGNGAAKAWSPVIARYVYRLADGTPYLQVCRTAAKQFFQNKWNGQMWVTGKPDGPKIPYRLSELLAAPLTAKAHMRRYRKHRKQGLRSVRILLDQMDADALIEMRLLKEDQRQDVKALQKALLGLLYRAEENLA